VPIGEDLAKHLADAGVTSVWRVKGPYDRDVSERWWRFEVYVDEWHDAHKTPDLLLTHREVEDVSAMEAVPYGFMVNAYVRRPAEIRPPEAESDEQMTLPETTPDPTEGATGSAPADHADAHGRGSDARAHRRPRHRARTDGLR
jgi:hypothetical protein